MLLNEIKWHHLILGKTLKSFVCHLSVSLSIIPRVTQLLHKRDTNRVWQQHSWSDKRWVSWTLGNRISLLCECVCHLMGHSDCAGRFGSLTNLLRSQTQFNWNKKNKKMCCQGNISRSPGRVCVCSGQETAGRWCRSMLATVSLRLCPHTGSRTQALHNAASELIVSSALPAALQWQVLVKQRPCETVTPSQPVFLQLQVRTSSFHAAFSTFQTLTAVRIVSAAGSTANNPNYIWGWRRKTSNIYIILPLSRLNIFLLFFPEVRSWNQTLHMWNHWYEPTALPSHEAMDWSR